MHSAPTATVAPDVGIPRLGAADYEQASRSDSPVYSDIAGSSVSQTVVSGVGSVGVHLMGDPVVDKIAIRCALMARYNFASDEMVEQVYQVYLGR